MPLTDKPDYDKDVRPLLEQDNDGHPITVEHVAIVVRDKQGIDKVLLIEVTDPNVEIFGYHRKPGRVGEADWQLWPRGNKLIGR